jgi:hypothetical protein
LRGDTSSRIEIEIDGLKFEVDLLRGQKTGFYLDQKQNYQAVAQYAKNRRVLDCFTNHGAFALACACAGASEVTGVEANTESLAMAKKNAERNQLRVQWIEQDVFQFLRGAEKMESQYDLIVLDPPSLSRTSCSRFQAFVERWIACYLFLLPSRQRKCIRANDRGGAGGRTAFGPATSPIRAIARSSGAPDFARDGIFQRRLARDDAGTLSDGGSQPFQTQVENFAIKISGILKSPN